MNELNKQKVFISNEFEETKIEVEENLSTIMNLEAKVSKLEGNLAELEANKHLTHVALESIFR